MSVLVRCMRMGSPFPFCLRWIGKFAASKGLPFSHLAKHHTGGCRRHSLPVIGLSLRQILQVTSWSSCDWIGLVGLCMLWVHGLYVSEDCACHL
jgi:hypothetical protein